MVSMTYDQFMLLWRDDSDSVVCHTSGSTGEPKPIALTKRDMSVSARLTNAFFGINRSSVLSVPLPFDYIAARMMAVRGDIAGCKVIAPVPSNSPDFFGGYDHIDLLAIVPSQVEALVAVKDVGKRVRNVIVGGAPLSEVRRHAIVKAGISGYITYGMTETCSHIALADVSDDNSVFHAIDKDTRFAVDTRGCLVAEVPHLSIGRVVTNDVVSILSPTSFKWLGRADNVINSAGLKIYPEQVERELAESLPATLPFYVIGVNDPAWGSAVAIVYEGTAEMAAAIEAAIDGIVDRHHRPRYIIPVRQISRTRSGKLIREYPSENLGIIKIK